MKIAAFHGSPRKGGNSELLLEEALRAVREAGHEVSLFKPAGMDIAPCRNCGGCATEGRCVVRDEMTVVYDAIRGAHRFVVSSPIFFLGMPAQIKKMIDRCQAFWSEKYLLGRSIEPGAEGRKGLLLLVGGMKMKKGYTCAGATATAFFRTISVDEHETLSYAEIDAKGAVRDHPTALREAYEAGARLVQPAGSS
jgi:multimeric flavodoxin WrbA